MPILKAVMAITTCKVLHGLVNNDMIIYFIAAVKPHVYIVRYLHSSRLGYPGGLITHINTVDLHNLVPFVILGSASKSLLLSVCVWLI